MAPSGGPALPCPAPWDLGPAPAFLAAASLLLLWVLKHGPSMAHTTMTATLAAGPGQLNVSTFCSCLSETSSPSRGT